MNKPTGSTDNLKMEGLTMKQMKRQESDPNPINYKKEIESLDSLPTIARLVTMYRKNREVLGLPDCPTQEIEHFSLLVYDSMEAPTRIFHNLDHIFDLMTQKNSKGVGHLQLLSKMLSITR